MDGSGSRRTGVNLIPKSDIPVNERIDSETSPSSAASLLSAAPPLDNLEAALPFATLEASLGSRAEEGAKHHRLANATVI